MTGLYGGMVFTLPPFFCVGWYEWTFEYVLTTIQPRRLQNDNAKTTHFPYQFAVVMLTVTAVFHIVQIVAGLFAQQTERLGACDVKLLLAIGFIALHTCAHLGLGAFAHLLTDVTVCMMDWR